MAKIVAFVLQLDRKPRPIEVAAKSYQGLEPDEWWIAIQLEILKQCFALPSP